MEGGYGIMGGLGWVRRKHGHVGCRWKGLGQEITMHGKMGKMGRVWAWLLK